MQQATSRANLLTGVEAHRALKMKLVHSCGLHTGWFPAAYNLLYMKYICQADIQIIIICSAAAMLMWTDRILLQMKERHKKEKKRCPLDEGYKLGSDASTAAASSRSNINKDWLT